MEQLSVIPFRKKKTIKSRQDTLAKRKVIFKGWRKKKKMT